MLKQLFKFFPALAPPVFPEDEDKTRRAMYAHWIAFLFLGAVIAFEVWARVSEDYTGLSLIDFVAVVVASICIIGLALLKRGHVRSTSVMLVVLVWATEAMFP